MTHSLYDIAALDDAIRQGLTLLTPNVRLARRIKTEWDAKQLAAGLGVWEPLAVYPLEHWLQQRWRQAVSAGELAPRFCLEKLQELQLWEQVIAQHTAETDAASLLNPASAAELASQARDLVLRWEVDVSAANITQLFSMDGDSATFLQWLQRFEAELSAKDWCVPADCLRDLCEFTKAQHEPGVVLLEFAELAPLEQRCLGVQSAVVQRLDAESESSHALLHPFSDSAAELRGVAAWAAEAYRGSSRTTVGIVLTANNAAALEYQLRREFDCLGDEYTSLPVNFSAGISLSGAPVVRDALALLGLAGARVSVAQVVALFQSRFVNLPDAHTSLAQFFLRRLRNGGVAQVEMAALRNFASTVTDQENTGLDFGERLLSISQMRELRGKKVPSAWAELFHAVLEIWGWPGQGDLDSLEYQQVTRWYDNLDAFAGLDAVCEQIPLASALSLLRDSCDRQISHPQTVDSRVQVLGPLEAAGLAFDHLWICGMQGNAWPAAPRPNPLIPVSLQATRQMPHATPEREWAFGESLLAQYRRTCATVHASYSQQMDGIADQPSGLLADFQAALIQEPHTVSPDWEARQCSAQREIVSDYRAPALSPQQRKTLRGGAGLLESQSQCPFQAFARYRLQVEPLGDPVAGISPSERGTLVHEALQLLWTDIGSHNALLALDAEALESILQRAVTQGLRSVPGHRRAVLGSVCMELESVRLYALLQEWLAVERQRGEFQIAALEANVELTLSQLNIRLRVDRVDKLPDGTSVIIDYKTGRSTIADWMGERPPKPQLLLYGLAAEEPPAALTFAQLRPRDSGYIGIGAVETIPGVAFDIGAAVKERMDVNSWTELNATWRIVLERLAGEFVAGEAAVDPLSKSCTYCGLQALCRIDINNPAQTSP